VPPASLSTGAFLDAGPRLRSLRRAKRHIRAMAQITSPARPPAGPPRRGRLSHRGTVSAACSTATRRSPAHRRLTNRRDIACDLPAGYLRLRALGRGLHVNHRSAGYSPSSSPAGRASAELQPSAWRYTATCPARAGRVGIHQPWRRIYPLGGDAVRPGSGGKQQLVGGLRQRQDLGCGHGVFPITVVHWVPRSCCLSGAAMVAVMTSPLRRQPALAAGRPKNSLQRRS
jgi:hypothetical protein